jgi:small subunit ribosomal protein S21
MIIIKIKDGIEKALKELKHKTIKIKQIQQLREQQEFQKKSVKKRLQLKKAIYKQRQNNDR